MKEQTLSVAEELSPILFEHFGVAATFIISPQELEHEEQKPEGKKPEQKPERKKQEKKSKK